MTAALDSPTRAAPHTVRPPAARPAECGLIEPAIRGVESDAPHRLASEITPPEPIPISTMIEGLRL